MKSLKQRPPETLINWVFFQNTISFSPYVSSFSPHVPRLMKGKPKVISQCACHHVNFFGTNNNLCIIFHQFFSESIDRENLRIKSTEVSWFSTSLPFMKNRFLLYKLLKNIVGPFTTLLWTPSKLKLVNYLLCYLCLNFIEIM